MFAVKGRCSQGEITLDEAIDPGIECDVVVVFPGENAVGSIAVKPNEIRALRQQRYDLTDREMEVLELLRDGHTNQDIAERLDLGAGTVRNYCSSIYKKLAVPNRTAAVSIAVDAGLLVT